MTKYLKSVLLLFLVCTSACAQEKVTYGDHHFGIDTDQRIIVCTKDYVAQLLEREAPLETISFGELEYNLENPIIEPKTHEVYTITNQDISYKLYITDLPISKISTDIPIENEPKSIAQFQYGSISKAFDSPIGIELRGNSALKYPKKSYDMELRINDSTKKTAEASFQGLRKDDDWQFNSLYNEPLKLRSYFSNKLWLEVYQPAYISEEEKAKSGIDVLLSEVFLNNHYKGIYIINEQVDRKQLRLKKYKDSLKLARGLLYKASAYQDGTAFKSAPKFNNAFPSWSGFVMKYPYENYEAHYDNLHDFVNFVATADDSRFTAEIETKLDIENAIDYFLFINLLRATDNISKNYFLARYDEKTPFFFVPWDLDGVLGIIQDGKRISTTNDILSNNLFNRLQETNAASFNQRLSDRWKALRQGPYSTDALLAEINSMYVGYSETRMYEREFNTWPDSIRKEDDLDYLKNWLKQRIEFLDTHFE